MTATDQAMTSQVSSHDDVMEPHRLHRAPGQLTPGQADSRRPKPINLADYRTRRKQALGGLTHEYQTAA